VWIQKVFVTIK